MLRRLRRLSDRTPLRVRLVAAVLALVTAALLGAGLVAAATLRGYLMQREDSQLRAATTQIAQGDVNAGGHGHGGPGPDGEADRLPSAYVTETLDATGAISSGPSSHLVDHEQSLPVFPTLTTAQATTRNQNPFTVSSENGSGQWRVIAVPLADGSGTLLVATSLGDLNGTVDHLEVLELIIGAVALIVIAAVGSYVVHRSLRPLREVEETAAAIAAGDLSRRVPDRDERTEVGRLGGAINAMLEQIETSFAVQSESEASARRSEERMRRFVADASHELRTPLTSIRGFAELYRLQDQGTTSPEVARGISRIEEEATRLGALVEDLLLLARLDREPTQRSEVVDLLQIAGNAVHDSQIITLDRAITLQVGATDPPPIVLGDPHRLHQVLANLLSNAVRYTPARTPIQVRVATARDQAVVEVIDHGPGLPDDSAERVFERFYRADSARNREDGGTGLGLAIVAAIVARHHGRVDVTTTPGGGATFRVTLPLADVPAAVAVR